MGLIAGSAVETFSNGLLPPLPDEIPITGETALGRVARYARDLRRTYRPLPGPGDEDVRELIGAGRFTVSAHAYTRGIEYILLQPRGEDETFVHPVSAEVTDSVFTAHFADADVAQIVRERDVAVIVITPSAELRCNLDDGRLRRAFDPLRR